MANTAFLTKPTESLDLARTVDHVKFLFNMRQGDNVVVVFKVGYIERPSADHVQAQQRVVRALDGLKQELAMMRAWGGNVTIDGMVTKIVNPEVTEVMAAGFEKAAAEAYPERAIGMCWVCSIHGERGYSVQMVARP